MRKSALVAEPVVTLPGAPPLPGPAQSWAPGESPAGMPAADGGASGGGHPVMDSLGINDSGLKKMTDKLADMDRNKIGKTDEAIAKIDADAARYKPIAESQLAASVRTADTLKAWDADYESAKRKTDPVVAFGSFGSVFGILASAFTHAPMENALNASAAAMNAIHANDDKAYDRAYKAWQDNEALAVKRANLQHAAYQDAISLMQTNAEMGANKLKLEFIKFGDHKNLLLHEAGMDEDVFKNIAAFYKARTGLEESFAGRLRSSQQMSEAMADPRFKLPPGDPKRGEMIRELELRWTQSKNADEEFNRQYLLEHTGDFSSENYARAYGAFKAGQRSGLSVADQEIFDSWKEKNPDATPEQEAAFRATLGGGTRARSTGAGNTTLTEKRQIAAQVATELGEWKQANPKATAAEIGQKQDALFRQHTAASGAPTSNRVDDIRGKIDQTDNILRLADKNVAFLEKFKGGAGLMGKIMRGEEILGNIVGAGTQSERVQFRRNVLELQEIVPRILTDSNGRPLASAQAKVDGVVAGLAAGDTGPNTLRAYRELIADIKKRQQDYRGRIEGGYDPGKPSSGAGRGGTSTQEPAPDAKLRPWERDKEVDKKVGQ